MGRHKLRLSDFILTPIKVAVLAALPLAAGIEVGNRATAGDGITGATRQMAQDTAQTFNTTLANGYRTLASMLEQSGRDPKVSTNDWADAQYFALKGMAADRGENDGPENTNAWTLTPGSRTEIDAYRPRLLAAVSKMPEIKRTSNFAAAQALADAQVNFDCWVERAEEAAHGGSGAEQCRKDFETALAEFDSAVGGQNMAAATQPAKP